MKCPNCSCELELKAKDGMKFLPEEIECSLVKSLHGEIGKSIDKDYASSKNQVTEENKQ